MKELLANYALMTLAKIQLVLLIMCAAKHLSDFNLRLTLCFLLDFKKAKNFLVLVGYLAAMVNRARFLKVIHNVITLFGLDFV